MIIEPPHIFWYNLENIGYVEECDAIGQEESKPGDETAVIGGNELKSTNETCGSVTSPTANERPDLVAQAQERQKVVESVALKLDQIRGIGDRLAQHPGIVYLKHVRQGFGLQVILMTLF